MTAATVHRAAMLVGEGVGFDESEARKGAHRPLTLTPELATRVTCLPTASLASHGGSENAPPASPGACLDCHIGGLCVSRRPCCRGGCTSAGPRVCGCCGGW